MILKLPYLYSDDRQFIYVNSFEKKPDFFKPICIYRRDPGSLSSFYFNILLRHSQLRHPIRSEISSYLSVVFLTKSFRWKINMIIKQNLVFSSTERIWLVVKSLNYNIIWQTHQSSSICYFKICDIAHYLPIIYGHLKKYPKTTLQEIIC